VASHNRAYAMLNDLVVRQAILNGACGRYGYAPDRIEMRLYVGNFAGSKKGLEEHLVREWCASQVVGGGPNSVFGVAEVAARARKVAASR